MQGAFTDLGKLTPDDDSESFGLICGVASRRYWWRNRFSYQASKLRERSGMWRNALQLVDHSIPTTCIFSSI